MKSIRLSLLVYFLGLLAVALFAASLLVYNTAEQTLEAKRVAMAQLIQCSTTSAAAKRKNVSTRLYWRKPSRWPAWFRCKLNTAGRI